MICLECPSRFSESAARLSLGAGYPSAHNYHDRKDDGYQNRCYWPVHVPSLPGHPCRRAVSLCGYFWLSAAALRRQIWPVRAERPVLGH